MSAESADARLKEMKFRVVICFYWVMIALSVLFKDIHDFFIPDFFAMISEGVVDGTVVTECQIFLGSIVVLLFLSMIPVNLLMGFRAMYILNIVAVTLFLSSSFLQDKRDLDDYLFLVYSIFIGVGILYFSHQAQKT